MTDKKPLIILGINYGGHDSAACLVVDGKIVAACEQERYDKQKHSRAFPSEAIADCLKIGKITLSDVDEIAVGYDPILLIRETYLKSAMEDEARLGFLIRDIERIKQSYALKEEIREKTGFNGAISYYVHHLCHLASAYYVSGFESALLVSHDGMGEVDCSLIGEGKDGEISVLHPGNRYPYSLGLLYSAITHYLGWKHHCDEGIIMGLAPYGDDTKLVPGSDKTYRQIFEEIISETGDFSYAIDTSWIAYHEVRDKWISDKFTALFGVRREHADPLTDHHKHIAAALQNRLESIVLNQLKKAKDQFGHKKLCLAGGVALNCSLNGAIMRSGLFDEIFVQPASGDAGTAIGAALLGYKKLSGVLRPIRDNNAYLGASFSNDEIEQALKKLGANYSKAENIYEETARALNSKKIVGWFQGAAEFGPRALGDRSILTAPYPADMKDYVNARVKFREEFRPFAPAVLAEHAQEYFEIDQESPHMLIAAKVKDDKVSEIPAVIHVDQSARVQTVKEENNPRFRKLLEAFYKLSGCPVLLNTSFNVKGQPIVNSPEDAVKSFLSTNIDVLAIGDFLATKEAVNK